MKLDWISLLKAGKGHVAFSVKTWPREQNGGSWGFAQTVAKMSG